MAGAKSRAETVQGGAQYPTSCIEAEATDVSKKSSEPPLDLIGAEAADASKKPSEPPLNLNGGAPKHSSSAGLDAADAVLQELPRSPSLIDPEIQAQAWVILPDLAKDLNTIKFLNQQLRPATVGGSEAINPHPEVACKQPEDRARKPQDDTELQGKLRARILASQKGKSTMGERCIHDGVRSHVVGGGE